MHKVQRKSEPVVLAALQSSHLPTRHRIRPITGSGKLWSAVRIPSELLRSNGSRCPTGGRIDHTVIHNPILSTVRTLCETGMTDSDSRGEFVLVEDTPVVLDPILGIHWVFANKLELSETVVGIVTYCGRVDDT